MLSALHSARHLVSAQCTLVTGVSFYYSEDETRGNQGGKDLSASSYLQLSSLFKILLEMQLALQCC